MDNDESRIDFTSTDEVLAFLAQTRAETQRANRLLTEEQRTIGWGSPWVRYYHDLVIFGRVETIEEVLAEEARGVVEIEDDNERAMALDEVAYNVGRIKASYDEGYMYGWCNSVIEVDPGEVGSTHVTNIWPISEALYAHAKAHGWDPDQFQAIFRLELYQCYEKYRSWAENLPARLRALPPEGDSL